MKIITDERCTEYHRAGHPERPARITSTLAKLRAQSELEIDWLSPAPASDTAILRAHDPEHIARLRIPRDFDGDTAYHEGIEEHARASAGAALLAMDTAQAGGTVFSLMRPPSHHATRNQAMGFCYLNGIAIATLEALATGTRRVAILDFDVHHGNGTEAILQNVAGTTFHSVHQHPCYPGTGASHNGANCFNYPVAPNSPREVHRQAIAQALEDLREFKPELVGVSAGFDGYVGDPLAQCKLEIADFHWIGSRLRALRLPVFSVLEGGYSNDLPDLIFSYLKGLNGLAQ